MIDDSKTRYGTVSRYFHWIMAVLVGWQLLKLSERINDGEHWVGQNLVPWHVSIGALILVLVILRLLWVAKQGGSRPQQNPATVVLVRLGHALMYVAMVLLPITGMLYLVGGGYGVTVFGITLFSKGPEVPWMATIGSVHSPIAWVFLVLIIGHIAIALYHGLIKRDGVLQRML